eukprot:6178655-Pleurochrysis_carterae.AAC.1
MVVNHFYLYPGLFEESCDAVRAAQRSREEEQNRLGGMSSQGFWSARDVGQTGRLFVTGIEGGHSDGRTGSR